MASGSLAEINVTLSAHWSCKSLYETVVKIAIKRGTALFDLAYKHIECEHANIEIVNNNLLKILKEKRASVCETLQNVQCL